MDEFILTFLVTGSDSTLPLYIYGSLRFRLSPELNAVSALILGGSFLLVLAAALISVRADRRSAKATVPSMTTLVCSELRKRYPGQEQLRARRSGRGVSTRGRQG